MQKFVHYLLIFLIAAYVITGLGISQYRIVEAVTFGWLTKALSFRIHSNSLFLVVFLLALCLHIYFAWAKRRGQKM